MKKLKKILKYLVPYYGNIILNFILNLFQIIFSVFSLLMIIPFLRVLFGQEEIVTVKPDLSFSGNAFNDFINYYLGQVIEIHGKKEALLVVSGFVIVMILLKNILFYFSKFVMVPVRNGVIRDMRNTIYKKILELQFSYFTEERKGDIISKMTNDLKEIEWTIMTSVEMLIRNPLTIIVYLVTLIIMSPQLTVFVLILIPVSGAIIGTIGRSLKKTSRRAQDQMGTLLSKIEETLSGLRIIKAFTAENFVFKGFFNFNEEYNNTMNKVYRKNYLASPMSEFLGVLMITGIMYYGGSLVLNNEGTLSPEAFIGYIAVFSQIINPAKAFSTAIYNVQKGAASIDRINIILEAKNTIIEKEDAKDVNSFEEEIEFSDVSFAYENTYVLKNINLKVKKGQTIALVGQSGSGKSTLADLIPRFYDVSEGEIKIDGINIKDLKISDLRNIMGNVNQEPILFNDTIKNNIAFGSENVPDEKIIEAAKIANAHDFILQTEAKYDTGIGDRGTKLSGGQRQRLSIARAVLKNPPIMILDEATSSLDTESERAVQDALDKLMQNRTSVVIAHRLSTIRNADLICVLHKGEIIERGTHDELINLNGNYKKLYDLQIF
ncbi:MAG: ABC transporter ATP-binding protein [Bacteroidetes bacterium]|nr:MAG: ABC transporter ATP-binding protein [Bacteroidota bacterium]